MDANIGKKLDGRYEISELIGVGGMADVYKATDIMENKTVAVKILKNEFSKDAEFIRRFRNESKAIAVLSHPNIVKVYDVGFTDEIQFIVMEYIDGISLKEYIDQLKVLRWQDCVHFTVQILRALQHAHDRGIVHRDIKPQNIMLLSNGTIKVMDFGIARLARDEGITLSEKTIGSVHYISPEQARGDVTDEKSDLYSVGVMMYEMLTGTKPFDGDSAVSVALMHLQDVAVYPRDIVDTIPEAMEEIIVHAMEKDVEKRYQTAAEMIKDLEAFRNDQTVVFGYMERVSAPVTEAPAANKEATIFFNPLASQESATKPMAAVNPVVEVEDDDDDDDYEPRGYSYIIPVLSAVTVVVVIIATIIISMVIKNTLASDNNVGSSETTMPQLVGMTYSEAKSKYSNIINLVANEEYNADYAAGIIIYQDKGEGRTIKIGDKVTITVSKGPRYIKVPDVLEFHYNTASSALVNKGLSVEFKDEYSDDITKDYVIETIPAAGETVVEGTKIIIVRSLGPLVNEIKVPNVVTKDVEAAEKTLSNLKFDVIIREISSKEPKGYVLSQSIDAGEYAQRGSQIVLYVSSGIPESSEYDLSIPMPTGVKGKFTFNIYDTNGTLVTSHTFDEISYVSSSFTFKFWNSGVKSYYVDVKNEENQKNILYATYDIDFDNQTHTNTYLDENAFVTLTQDEETVLPPDDDPSGDDPVTPPDEGTDDTQTEGSNSDDENGENDANTDENSDVDSTTEDQETLE